MLIQSTCRKSVLLLLPITVAPLVGCSSSDDAPVVLPQSVSLTELTDERGLDTLAAALNAAALDDDLDAPGELTLLAPTEEAFGLLPQGTLDFLLMPENQAVLADVLTYHVVTGANDAATVSSLDTATTLQGSDVVIEFIAGDLYVNDARVVQTDVDASNGILHEIDRVLTPPTDLVATLQARGLDTLVAAVEAAGLAGALSGPGPFTVLAPSEAAFAALPAGTLDTLLSPENMQQLVELLQYHVVPAAATAQQALSLVEAPTLFGTDVLFSEAASGAVEVGGVTISTYNVPCTNGVLHVIDAVLSVPEDLVTTAESAGLTTLLAALDAVGPETILTGDEPFTVFAPTNDAFAALGDLLTTLLLPENADALRQVLRYHIVGADQLVSTELAELAAVTTLEGSDAAIDASGPGITVAGANVAAADVITTQGVVHVIDAVIVPRGFELPMEPLVALPGGDAPWSDPAGVAGAERFEVSTPATGAAPCPAASTARWFRGVALEQAVSGLPVEFVAEPAPVALLDDRAAVTFFGRLEPGSRELVLEWSAPEERRLEEVLALTLLWTDGSPLEQRAVSAGVVEDEGVFRGRARFELEGSGASAYALRIAPRGEFAGLDGLELRVER